MKYARIYFCKGAPRDKKTDFSWMDFAVKDPPVAGNTMCFILGEGKTRTIFHPFTLLAYRVRPNCTELKSAQIKPFEIERMIDIITKKWLLYKQLDMQRSYDVAAQVIVQLGGKIPEYTGPSEERRGKMPEEKTAGKPSAGERFKIVKRKGRKGEVAAFFEFGTKPILEAMAKLHMTRSAVLSQLYMLWKDHGIGYVISKDCVELISQRGIFEDELADLEVPGDLDTSCFTGGEEEDIFQ